MEAVFIWNILFSLLLSLSALKFNDITSTIFYNNSGLIAAFGHFNSDEFTDIFTLQDGSKKLQVLLGSESERFESVVNCSFDFSIINVIPADFNADLLIDILIVLDLNNEGKQLYILWGSLEKMNCKDGTLINNGSFIQNEPVVFDFNGDMIPDILCESAENNRYVLISSSNKSFSTTPLPVSKQKLKHPHSSALLDLNNDLATDLMINGENNFELWINSGDKFVMTGNINYPNNSIKYLNHIASHIYPLQSTFVDLNLDAKLDHVLPVCFDSKCLSVAILVYNSSIETWEILLDDFEYLNRSWGFRKFKSDIPVTVRAGDIDMDGYPDLLAVLQSKSDIKLVLLKNVKCSFCKYCYFDRCLKIEWQIPGIEHIKNIEFATFFDIYEDGVLDILIASYSNQWKIHALKNTENLDSCFMKVLVLSGVCHNCSLPEMAYGVNQPGPLVLFNMTKEDGQPLISSAVQMSQTAYFSLQLPYCLFGLGLTPNFIDALTVAVPSKFEKNVHKREWNQIIPNSQIVVIPSPPYDEKKWVKRLFVTPSHYVRLTCIALIGTCIFISILVAFLHWRERKEDKKEKMQDAYRFHFDAM